MGEKQKTNTEYDPSSSKRRGGTLTCVPSTLEKPNRSEFGGRLPAVFARARYGCARHIVNCIFYATLPNIHVGEYPHGLYGRSR